ncbi:NAD-P-binding protein [Mycena floridula]|nr:NAD-P-binding protein [Mycena floridula]
MGQLFSQPPFNPRTDLVDLKGKVAIVTGGNRGIGFGTVKHLARAGAKVYIAARSESLSRAAIEQIQAEGLDADLEWIKLDLSDPREARKSAEEFLTKEKRLDILVNNAGIYISPFIFTRTLLPLLTTTALQPGSDVRIVNVASLAHKLVPTVKGFKDIEDLNVNYRYGLPEFQRYCHSKLLGMLWTKSLQNRFDTSSPPIPITVLAIHPGGVDTFTQKWPFSRFWRVIVGWVINDIEHGSYTSSFAAAGKKVAEERKKYQGAYLESKPPGRIAEPSKQVSVGLGDQLITLTDQFCDSLK